MIFPFPILSTIEKEYTILFVSNQKEERKAFLINEI